MRDLTKLREKIVQAHAESGSSAEVGETYGYCESWVRRLSQQKRETGSVAPRSSARTDDQRTFDDKDEATIRELIKNKPDATLAEVAAAMGKPVSISTVCRTLKRLNLPRKKSRRTPPSKTGLT